MPQGPNRITPRFPTRITPPPRNGYSLDSSGPLDLPPELRPQLYPGRDTNVVGGVSPDQIPPVLDGPIEFVSLPKI